MRPYPWIRLLKLGVVLLLTVGTYYKFRMDNLSFVKVVVTWMPQYYLLFTVVAIWKMHIKNGVKGERTRTGYASGSFSSIASSDTCKETGMAGLLTSRPNSRIESRNIASIAPWCNVTYIPIDNQVLNPRVWATTKIPRKDIWRWVPLYLVLDLSASAWWAFTRPNIQREEILYLNPARRARVVEGL